jgi:hypothetical protein
VGMAWEYRMMKVIIIIMMIILIKTTYTLAKASSVCSLHWSVQI